jgi:hypothetical protein
MPTLTFTEGDTAMIVVHNAAWRRRRPPCTGTASSCPTSFDGVPYLTTAPIKAGETQVYKFPLVQSGTYWYHSHTKLQEQNGMHGALIIHKRNADTDARARADPERMDGHEALRGAPPAAQRERLERDQEAPDPSGHRAELQRCHQGRALGTKLTNEWKRMNAMDVSDVYYDLLPGQRPARRTKLRSSRRATVCGCASSTAAPAAISGSLCRREDDRGGQRRHRCGTRGGGPLHHGRGRDLRHHRDHPADSTAYELLATSEDRTRSTSVWLGDGIKQLAAPLANR